MRQPQLSVWMESAKKKAFRMYCLDQDVTMHDLINAFAEEVLAGKQEDLIKRLKKEKTPSQSL